MKRCGVFPEAASFDILKPAVRFHRSFLSVLPGHCSIFLHGSGLLNEIFECEKKNTLPAIPDIPSTFYL